MTLPDILTQAAAIKIGTDSPEWMQRGKRALDLHLAAPAFIPGATTDAELADRVRQAGKPN